MLDFETQGGHFDSLSSVQGVIWGSKGNSEPLFWLGGGGGGVILKFTV